MKSKLIVIGLLLAALALALAACSQAPAPAEQATPCPEAPACPECPAPPAPEPCPEPVVKNVPFEAEWVGSPHNDAEAEAFVHWNEDDPKEVPVGCATCHSSSGYQDFLGADGSPAGVVDKGVPVGETIQCATCHNSATATLSSVTFPSGAVVEGLGNEARCMVCHQGRASMVQIDGAIATNALTETLDTVSAELGFINIHYFAAAATLYGTQTKGGYEYAGKTYDAKNTHVDGYATCIGCHSPHTLELKLDECAVCHEGVASPEDLRKVRMASSVSDYDGDGDVAEGVAAEIEGLQAMLMTAIQTYAKDVAGAPIAYSAAAYPYFFNDANGDGAAGDDEAAFDNRFASWTGRLLKAAYNYQTSLKDPGAFAHGGKYIIQLLYDSIEDLNSAIAAPVDLSTAHREDAGHFAGNTMAFRDWDDTGTVPYSCVKCHTADGLPTFLSSGGTVAVQSTGAIVTTGVASMPSANGFKCSTCHNEAKWPELYGVRTVVFPSGKSLTFSTEKDDNGNFVPVNANLCILCHQGRSSKLTIDRDRVVAGTEGADTVNDKITFKNIHYFAAGATFFGAEAQGAYEFADKTYNGKSVHPTPADTCIGCHDPHALTVKEEACETCHAGQAVEEIRMTAPDYDGDGATEGVYGEVQTLAEALYAQIQAYAAAAGKPIVYDSRVYPYFLNDLNGNGVSDPDEAKRANGFNGFSANLLRAAYNYQLSQKDPGTFAHNPAYIVQIIIDSIEALGGDVSAYTRPEAPAAQ